jgi:membrane protease YdiL (CAAX protease family)
MAVCLGINLKPDRELGRGAKLGTMALVADISKWKLGGAIWIVGMIGVLAMTFVMLPVLISQHPQRAPRVPVWVALVAASAQGGVFLALFVWGGAVFSPRVGLRAPVFEALIAGHSLGAALLPQLLPGIIGGLAAAIVPWYFTSHGLIFEIHTPQSLLVAVLYGGITEEIFMRWGLMTLLVWSGWRVLQRSHGQTSSAIVWAAIVISAVIFGAGHLPATHILLGHLTRSTIASVIAGGSVFGVIVGYLYRRYGLESAMVCHGLSHVLAYAAHRVSSN